MRERARSSEDKQARARAILDAALAEWSESSYGELTMSAVAARTGLVKGALYKYFSTKEELLLALLESLFGAWLDDIDRRLLDGAGRWTPDEAAKALSGCLEGRDAFVRLLTVSGSILEHNIGEGRAREYKRLLHTRVTHTAALLESRLPSLGRDGAVRFLMQTYALLTGLGQMAFPAPVVRRVMAEPGFEMFRIDVRREFEAATRALLTGGTTVTPKARSASALGGPRRNRR